MKFQIKIQKTALCIAIDKKNIDIIKLLLNNKADINLVYISYIIHI